MLCIVYFSSSTFEVAQNALKLWANNVIPSLLPFFICIDLLKKTKFVNIIGTLFTPIMKPLFNVPGTGAFALSMGWLSGYPTGAKITSELYQDGKCTFEGASRLLAFTNTSGPLFIIGTCGIAMFNDSKIGVLLLISHILGSITVGFILRNHFSSPNSASIISQKSEKINTSEDLSLKILGKSIGISIQNSFSTLMLIGGYIVTFAIIRTYFKRIRYNLFYFQSSMPEYFGFSTSLLPYIEATFFGLLEVTNGLNILASLGTSSFTICLASFLLRFWWNIYSNASGKYNF